MPPVRSMPVAKPLKTERTHEENQERAYIAASRRSDRSLEARVESARRASEIHKRRTGRSLRVTEQDVVNEEMYEEEDDDLPMQYRRLTAHLQTTNADFDRRLAAYLTNHVAMRSALGAAVSDTYNHQSYINAPQFANNFPQFTQHNFTNPMLPPQMTNNSTQNFRQSPYMMPNQQGQPQPLHKRSASIATPQELHGSAKSSKGPTNAFIKPEDRRLSLSLEGISNHGMMRTPSTGSLANLKHEAKCNGSPPVKQESSPVQQQQQQPMPNPYAFGNDFNMTSNMPPLSMTLPMESQQLLGGSLDPNDPFSAMLLGRQDYHSQQSFYNYNPNGSSPKAKGFSPAEGMNQTLAPGVLDQNTSGQGSYSTPVSNADSGYTPMSGYGSFGYESQFDDMFKSSTSGLTTPGEHDWANLIDSNNVWEESPSQQTVV